MLFLKINLMLIRSLQVWGPEGLGTWGFGLGVLRFWQITLILIWCLWVWEPWGLGIWWAVSTPTKSPNPKVPKPTDTKSV